MKKRKAIILPIGVLVLLVVLCGTALAFMFKQTQIKDNLFEPAEALCEVRETANYAEADGLCEKTSVKVINTGNIDTYLRVRFVSYWVRSAGGDNQIAPIPSEMPEFKIADGWIKGSNDTYYYTSPVAPEQLTDELLAAGEKIILEEKNGYLQVIEVFAEAIQSRPASSVTEAWSVILNSNGIIISAP